MARLIPKRVVVFSSEKFFRKGELGRSTGSEFLVEFDLVLAEGEDGHGQEVARLIFQEKEKLDKRCLNAEYLRGAITPHELQELRDALSTRYDKVLGRSGEGDE